MHQINTYDLSVKGTQVGKVVKVNSFQVSYGGVLYATTKCEGAEYLKGHARTDKKLPCDPGLKPSSLAAGRKTKSGGILKTDMYSDRSLCGSNGHINLVPLKQGSQEEGTS